MRANNRWVIAVAGVFVQVALGAVYAWSVFREPLAKQFGWSIPEVTLTFTISIFVLGLSAFFGGLWLNRAGPRVVAVVGGALYGLGVFLASFSAHKLWWLYLSYGLVGGVGLGFGYIVPVAVLVKWFPDRRGLITGVAVGGFGAGALVTAPVASGLIQSVGVLPTFAYLGAAYFIVTVVAGLFMRDPPEGWRPEGWTPTAAEVGRGGRGDYTLGEALRTWQWYALWLLLFLNTFAGISIISQEAPIFQEIVGVSAVAAAGMVGLASTGNALGRVFWAWASDYLTRRTTFLFMFLLQVLLFWLLPGAAAVSLMTFLAFVVLMCYGGGFGAMPAFAADYFGPKNVGPIYGLMLTAWGGASAAGPLLIAYMRQTTGSYSGALRVIAVVMAVSALLPLLVSPPRTAPAAARRSDDGARSSIVSVTRLCLIALFIAAATLPAAAQTPQSDAPLVAGAPNPQALRLSPEAEQVADKIGVAPLLTQLKSMPGGPPDEGSRVSPEAIAVRQEVTERVLSASLDIDSVNATIDSEMEHIRGIRADSQSKRDRAQNIINIASIVTGGAFGAITSAMQFKPSTVNPGNGIGVAGGVGSVLLSIIGIRKQGGRRSLGDSPRMLARFFGRRPAAAEEIPSAYPESVWSYLNSAEPSKPDAATRRERLVAKWRGEGRIARDGSPKGELEYVSGNASRSRRLSIDELDDRVAMLLDVRASVSLMKRGLSEILRGLAAGGGR